MLYTNEVAATADVLYLKKNIQSVLRPPEAEVLPVPLNSMYLRVFLKYFKILSW